MEITIRSDGPLSQDIYITEDERFINITKLLPINSIEIKATAGGVTTSKLTLAGTSLDLVSKVNEIQMQFPGNNKDIKKIKKIEFHDGTVFRFSQ